jgi:hypothetical protein
MAPREKRRPRPPSPDHMNRHSGVAPDKLRERALVSRINRCAPYLIESPGPRHTAPRCWSQPSGDVDRPDTRADFEKENAAVRLKVMGRLEAHGAPNCQWIASAWPAVARRRRLSDPPRRRKNESPRSIRTGGVDSNGKGIGRFRRCFNDLAAASEPDPESRWRWREPSWRPGRESGRASGSKSPQRNWCR